jgi:hypothetical protein
MIASIICCDRSDVYLKSLIEKLTEERSHTPKPAIRPQSTGSNGYRKIDRRSNLKVK